MRFWHELREEEKKVVKKIIAVGFVAVALLCVLMMIFV